MKKNAIKPNDMAFGAQLLTCKTNLPTYAAVLKITPEEVASQAADALAFNYWLGCNAIMHRDAQQFTKWKDLMRDGGAVRKRFGGADGEKQPRLNGAVRQGLPERIFPGQHRIVRPPDRRT